MNPFIQLQIDNFVSLGFQNTISGPGTADGTLVLGSNSVLNVGTPTARAGLSLGWNSSNNATSDATGADALSRLRVKCLVVIT